MNQDEFIPYSLNDYRRWKKKQGKKRMGRLPVNKNTTSYRRKVAKVSKMKEYSKQVK
jgi:hypothetical protein